MGLSAVIRPSTLCCPFARRFLPLSVVIRYGDCWFTFIYRKAEFLAVGWSFDDRSYALNLRALCILPNPLASGVVLPFSIIIIPHFCGFVKGFLKSFSKIFSSVATALRLFQSTLLPDNTGYHHVPLVLNYALSPLDFCVGGSRCLYPFPHKVEQTTLSSSLRVYYITTCGKSQ